MKLVLSAAVLILATAVALADPPRVVADPPPVITVTVTVDNRPPVTFSTAAAVPQWRATAPAQYQGYTPHWTHPPDLTGHLTGHHGVDAARLRGMGAADMERLHDQLHDAEFGRTATVRATAMSSYSITSANCPGGVCPSPQQGPIGRVFGRLRGR